LAYSGWGPHASGYAHPSSGNNFVPPQDEKNGKPNLNMHSQLAKKHHGHSTAKRHCQRRLPVSRPA
jgi:hypothetical protein